MIVVLAEKPSVARDIARVLGAKDKKDGWIEGDGYQVTWAFGHLVGLAEPAYYGWKKWVRADLPMIPDRFDLEPRYTKGSNVDEKAKRQLETIQRLFDNAEEIVVATDAGREGELIFRNIYNYFECKTPFKRLWISSLTPTAIKKGFEELKSGSEYDNIYRSAECRSKADWLVGFNASRAVTLANPNKGKFTIGRVQTPTFAFVCKRWTENKEFRAQTYFKAQIVVSAAEGDFKAVCPESFNKKEDAEKAIRSAGANVVLTKAERSEVSEKPPLPFSLTDLQREANKKLGFSAQKTLDILQELYEKKMTTYPRTESSYLPEDMKDAVRNGIGNIAGMLFMDAYKEAITGIRNGMNGACFNNKKLTDHHAVVPTFENTDRYAELGEEQKKVYEMIAKRLVAALMRPCKKNRVAYEFVGAGAGKDGFVFKCAGSSIVDYGWRIFGKDEEKDEEEEEGGMLPTLEEGEKHKVKGGDVLEKKTTRPPLLTEAELLRQMETAGKTIEDAELSKAIKECGLGTPATRAGIIESLKDKDMIEVVDKKYLAPTERGKAIYKSVKGLKIAEATVTGEWERKLNMIAEGRYSAEEFVDEIKRYAGELVRIMDGVQIDVPETESAFERLTTAGAVCPVCGGAIKESPKAVFCENFGKEEEKCYFAFRKVTDYYKLDSDDAERLLRGEETRRVMDVDFGEKGRHRVRLAMSAEKRGLVYLYRHPMEGVACPKCGDAVMESDKLYYCRNNAPDKGLCGFKLFKEVDGHSVTVSELKSLLEKKSVGGVGFVTKDGEKYRGKMAMTEDYKVVRVREDETVGKCPLCGADVREGAKVWRCARRTRENPECGFVMFREMGGRAVSRKELGAVLKDKVAKGCKFKSEKGEYTADLVIGGDGKVVMRFGSKKGKV